MASLNQCASAFMAKVLAPLPANEEPADSPKFRRLIVRDMLMVWGAGMENVRVMQAADLLAWAAFRKSGERFITDGTPLGNAVLAAHQAVNLAQQKQALIPAPTMTQLRWKRRTMRHRGIPAEVAAVMAADARRLEAQEGH